jgi:hypothetical protein
MALAIRAGHSQDRRSRKALQRLSDGLDVPVDPISSVTMALDQPKEGSVGSCGQTLNLMHRCPVLGRTACLEGAKQPHTGRESFTQIRGGAGRCSPSLARSRPDYLPLGGPLLCVAGS